MDPSLERLETPSVGGVATHTVVVAGRPAELQTASGGTRPVNVLTLTLTLGDTHVVASAHSGGAATPGGPDVNPLIDEQTFISVLSHLRPYPQ